MTAIKAVARFLILTFLLLAGLLLAGGPVSAVPIDGRDSPYLALHQNDLVIWHAWNAETLALARREGKPIFLSIGYLACHWCHVMQDEHFRDPETAALINRLFVPVLVDREQQPDVDAFYMAAAANLGLPTGWPLNLFLNGDGTPFFGGVYFPPEPRSGMPSFRQILERVSQTHAQMDSEIRDQGLSLYATLRKANHVPSPVPGLDQTADHLLEQVDSFAGGFGVAPKFPYIPALDLLWRAHLRYGKDRYRDAVIASLSHMIRGGLHDHVGGGFYRYCVDAQWREPHFEKMLDVNAQMLALMTRVWKETRDPVLERTIRTTVRFLLEDLRLENGGFASALDADSRSPRTGRMTEGAYYVWRDQDIRRILGKEGADFLTVYGLENMEAGGVLFTLDDSHRPAALERLREARAKRPPPRRDDKVLFDWNAMAAAALAEAGAAFAEPSWIEAAEQVLALLANKLVTPSGIPAHVLYGGKAAPIAVLDDLAQGALASLTLYEVTGRKSYLTTTRAWLDRARSAHEDTELGGYFASPHDGAPLPVRLKPMLDHPNPSGNALMVEALARLYYLSGDTELRQSADRILETFSGSLDDSLVHAAMVGAADTLAEALQLVLVGKRSAPDMAPLLNRVLRTDLPGRILLVKAPESRLPKGHPARDKPQLEDRATAYVCRGQVCSLPVTTSQELSDVLRDMRRFQTSGK
ncbi:conserved exported protein of unknown function.Putative Spermatogenesis-associated protein. Containing a thioredoxin domain [Magnetospira sp. QH-2]|nr:conserved exported protein of unknown function.Putative Spermatogenesis-associated protein. Containing a thioredoxin domain [Magnetospira sp. QH-2]